MLPNFTQESERLTKEKPLLTQRILESRLSSISAPPKVKSRGFYSMINHLRNTDKQIDYRKTAQINFDDKASSISTPSLSEIETPSEAQFDLAKENSILVKSNPDSVGQKTPIDCQKKSESIDELPEKSVCNRHDQDCCADGGDGIDLLDKHKDLMEIQRKIAGKNKIFN